MLPWLVGKVFKCVCLVKTLVPLHPTYRNFTKRQTNTNLTLDPWITPIQTPSHLQRGPSRKVFPQVQTVRRNRWRGVVAARPVSLTSAKGHWVEGRRGGPGGGMEGWRESRPESSLVAVVWRDVWHRITAVPAARGLCQDGEAWMNEWRWRDSWMDKGKWGTYVKTNVDGESMSEQMNTENSWITVISQSRWGTPK